MQYLAVRAAIHVASVFSIYLSAAMLIPAAVDLYYGNPDWRVFAFSSLFTGGLGLAIALATQGRPPPLSSRFGFLVVMLLWLTSCAVAAVPFLAASVEMSFTDAVFEAVSGMTTTGATVIVGLDDLPPGMLLWRSLLQWFGGLGVIALGVFVLPFLNVGGVSYFQIESSAIDDRPFARFSTYTTALLAIYVALTIACAICYAAAGMTGFDALNHALTSISTAGFSTHDASLGYYDDNFAVLWVGTISMLIGALPFTILILFITRGRLDALTDPQIKVFVGYVLTFVLAVTIYRRLTTDETFWDALTHSAFNMTSVITTTGYASGDYMQWGPFVAAAAFVATFLGGCSGSTSGGIKAYRFLIVFELLANGLRRLIYPNTVVTVRYGNQVVEDEVQRAVVLFVASFLLLWGMGTLVLASTGLDLVTSLSGMAATLTNVGPGVGNIIGPAGTYASVPDPAKWVLSLAMLLGRLEILAVLVIFSPVFWER